MTQKLPGRFPRLRLLRQWFRDRREGKTKCFPGWTLVAYVIALAYFISPVDLIPDFVIPVVAWIDDFGVFVLASRVLSFDLRRYCRDVGIDPADHGL